MLNYQRVIIPATPSNLSSNPTFSISPGAENSPIGTSKLWRMLPIQVLESAMKLGRQRTTQRGFWNGEDEWWRPKMECAELRRKYHHRQEICFFFRKSACPIKWWMIYENSHGFTTLRPTIEWCWKDLRLSWISTKSGGDIHGYPKATIIVHHVHIGKCTLAALPGKMG